MAESAPPENVDMADADASNGMPKRTISNGSASSGSNSSSSSSSSSSEQHSTSGPHRNGRNDKRRKRSKKHSSKSDDGASGSDETTAASAAPSSSASAAAASAAAAEAAEDAKQTKFIQKVYDMAMAPENSAVLGFSLDGLSLELRDSSLLPPLLERYFKHNKPTSFIRQLNNYGFKTITSPSAENSNQHVFAHPLFRRGDPGALEKISRKTAVCVKKKSKGEIIRELQSKMEQMHKQLEQSEMHRLELFQRLMTLEAEGNQRIMAMETENQQLRSHLQHLRRSFQEASLRMDTMARGVEHPGYGTMFPPAIIEPNSHVARASMQRHPSLPSAFPARYGPLPQQPPQPQGAGAPQGNGNHSLHPVYAPTHEQRQPSPHPQGFEPVPSAAYGPGPVGPNLPPPPPPPPQLYTGPDPRLNFPPVVDHAIANQIPQQQQPPPPQPQQPPAGDTNGNSNGTGGNGMNGGMNDPFHLD